MCCGVLESVPSTPGWGRIAFCVHTTMHACMHAGGLIRPHTRQGSAACSANFQAFPREGLLREQSRECVRGDTPYVPIDVKPVALARTLSTSDVATNTAAVHRIVTTPPASMGVFVFRARVGRSENCAFACGCRCLFCCERKNTRAAACQGCADSVGQEAVQGACLFGVKLKAGPGAGWGACSPAGRLFFLFVEFFFISESQNRTEQAFDLWRGNFCPKVQSTEIGCTRLLLTCTARCALTLLGPLRLRRSPPPWS